MREIQGNGAEQLKAAIVNGHVDVCKKLIASGADVNAADEFGNTAMHIAFSDVPVEETRIALAKLLLQSGAPADVLDADGETPLYWAVRNGFLEGCHFLIESGANVNHRNYKDYPLLSMAAGRSVGRSAIPEPAGRRQYRRIARVLAALKKNVFCGRSAPLKTGVRVPAIWIKVWPHYPL